MYFLIALCMPLAVTAMEAYYRFCKCYIYPEITWGGENHLHCLNWPSYTNIVPQTITYECLINCYSYECD